MKTLQNKIDWNNEVKNNPTRFDARYYAESIVAPWYQDTDPRLFEFGDVVVKAYKCCPANGFTEKAKGWLVDFQQDVDGHTQGHTERMTTEVLAIHLAELYRVKADEKEPREDISEGMTVYPDDCLAEWHGRAAKVVRRWLADWGTWCLELEFSDGTRHEYAEKYVLTHQPWSVVGATCHHRWTDSDVVLKVTAVGQYYGIKAESEDGKVKWTGLARDFVPCTPDGRDLLPEPPKEIVIEDATFFDEQSGKAERQNSGEITDENEAARALAGKDAHFVVSDKDGRETLSHSFTFKDSFRNQANRIWIDVKEEGDVIGRWMMLKYDVIKVLANTGRVIVSHPDGERHCITLA